MNDAFANGATYDAPSTPIAVLVTNGVAAIKAAQRITERLPTTAIVMLSMHSDEGYVLRALKAGAKGYLLKDSAESDLIDGARMGTAVELIHLACDATVISL